MSYENWCDRLDVTDVLVRYATGIDSRNWTLFRTCWADDLDADYGPRIGRFHSPDEITTFMTTAHKNMGPTWHRLTNFSVVVQGDQAVTRCYVHAVLNVDNSEPDRWMEVIGHYDDVLRRTSSGWRITRRRVSRGTRVTGEVPR